MFDKTIQLLRAAARAENRAAGQRLAVISELDLLWLRQFGERETWGTDSHDAITDEIAATLGITRGMADSYLDYARAMRLRLPRVGALLVAGDIDYRTFQTIVYRTDLIADPDVLAAVDATLAVKVTRWPGITQGRLGGYVDRIVARADLEAVRRRRERRGDREVSIWGDADGLTEIFGRLHTTDAHAVDARLDALAATVCADDPRTRNQRRADAMGVLAIGADRLACRCGRSDCPAFSTPLPSPVLIHLIVDQTNLEGNVPAHGSLIGSDALIPTDVINELVRSAKLRPLIHPADAPPETGYKPSQALADFVRCRDLTCRFPGCDQPATRCDLDHTIPHAEGGPTHASNLKTLCRHHHRLAKEHFNGSIHAERPLTLLRALSEPQAVILKFMSDRKHVVLIHGTWCRGDSWTPARAAFEERGYTVHTPTLRYHELPLQEGAMKIAPLSMRDYTDDLVALVDSLDSPPLIVGLSLGGLLVQLVAARTRHAGVIAACPVPAAGFIPNPTMLRNGVRLVGRHYLQPRPWTKPLYPPTWQRFRRLLANTQTEETARDFFTDLVCESGRAYCEFSFWYLDRGKAATVNFAAVTTPVLVIQGECDRAITSQVTSWTAARYQRGTYVKIPGSDHLVFSGEALAVTMGHIDDWIARNHVLASA